MDIALKKSKSNHFVRFLILFLKMLGVRFLINGSSGVGHILPEMDGFFRRLQKGEVGGRFFLCLYDENNIAKDFFKIYSSIFIFGFARTQRVLFFLKMIRDYGGEEIIIDIGYSRMKCIRLVAHKNISGYSEPGYECQLNKIDGIKQWGEYYKIREVSQSNFPLLRAGWARKARLEIFNQLSISPSRPVCLLHVKNSIANATALPTDFETYKTGLRYLTDIGYQIILIGREKIDENSLKEFNIVDYSNSNLASFKNDICLAHGSDLLIASGSGVSYLGDCFRVPIIYANSWHHQIPPFSKNCIVLPALVEKKSSGKSLNIQEQINLYESLTDAGAENFPELDYNVRNISGDELLNAIKELEVLLNNPSLPLTDLQKVAKTAISETEAYSRSQSRISAYFLEKHIEITEFHGNTIEKGI